MKKGEKQCKFFTGEATSCKLGIKCKFAHVVSSLTPPSLQGVSQNKVAGTPNQYGSSVEVSVAGIASLKGTPDPDLAHLLEELESTKQLIEKLRLREKEIEAKIEKHLSNSARDVPLGDQRYPPPPPPPAALPVSLASSAIPFIPKNKQYLRDDDAVPELVPIETTAPSYTSNPPSTEYKDKLYFCKPCNTYVPLKSKERHESGTNHQRNAGTSTGTLTINTCAYCGKNPAPSKCSKCKQVWYCDKICQKASWKIHRDECTTSDSTPATIAKAAQQSKAPSKKPVRINLGDGKIVDALPAGTRVKLLNGGKGRDATGLIQKFNFAKFDPLYEVTDDDYRGIPFDADLCDYFCSYTVQFDSTKNIYGELSARVECSELHNDWVIETTSTAGPASITPPSISSFAYPKSPKFLLVSGISFFDCTTCFYSERTQAKLVSNSIPFTAMNFNKENIITALKSGMYSSCVMYGIGANGPGNLKLFVPHEDLKAVVVGWVKGGGKLIVQGEGCITNILSHWFETPWSSSAYGRRTYEVNESVARSFKVHKVFPEEYYCKAVSLVNVEKECALYEESPGDEGGECGLAVKMVGPAGGVVCFIGDVNAEDVTTSCLVEIGRCTCSPVDTTDGEKVGRDAKASGGVPCPACTFLNKPRATTCEVCLHSLVPAPPANIYNDSINVGKVAGKGFNSDFDVNAFDIRALKTAGPEGIDEILRKVQLMSPHATNFGYRGPT